MDAASPAARWEAVTTTTLFGPRTDEPTSALFADFSDIRCYGNSASNLPDGFHYEWDVIVDNERWWICTASFGTTSGDDRVGAKFGNSTRLTSRGLAASFAQSTAAAKEPGRVRDEGPGCRKFCAQVGWCPTGAKPELPYAPWSESSMIDPTPRLGHVCWWVIRSTDPTAHGASDGLLWCQLSVTTRVPLTALWVDGGREGLPV